MLLSSSNLHPIDPCGLFHIDRYETISESIRSYAVHVICLLLACPFPGQEMTFKPPTA